MPNPNCKYCKSCKGVSAGNFNFYGCYHAPYKGKWIAEITKCPLKGRELVETEERRRKAEQAEQEAYDKIYFDLI